jgi:ribosome-binding protein aMBF1 (putative translation factor)
MIMLLFVHLSSSEIISCKECGQHFGTVDALREHEKSEQQDKELQNKGL